MFPGFPGLPGEPIWLQPCPSFHLNALNAPVCPSEITKRRRSSGQRWSRRFSSNRSRSQCERVCVCLSEAETEGRRGTAAAAALQVSAVQTCLVSAVVPLLTYITAAWTLSLGRLSDFSLLLLESDSSLLSGSLSRLTLILLTFFPDEYPV